LRLGASIRSRIQALSASEGIPRLAPGGFYSLPHPSPERERGDPAAQAADGSYQPQPSLIERAGLVEDVLEDEGRRERFVELFEELAVAVDDLGDVVGRELVVPEHL
jgi:hypothetical protein